MLTIHQLEITIEAQTLLALDTYCGSALRGAFFHALWKRFCANREATNCYNCPLNEGCSVSTLVAPLRQADTVEGGRKETGRDMPRPYIITPMVSQIIPSVPSQAPVGGGGNSERRLYQPGETYTFGLTLIGTASKLYQYVLRAFQEMEQSNLGHPLQELEGRRGRFRVSGIDAVHPFTSQRVCLWRRGDMRPARLQCGVSVSDVALRARQLSSENLRMHFLSPTRLVSKEQVLHHPNLTVLLLRMAQRLEHLCQEYGQPGDTRNAMGRDWYLEIKKQATEVRVIEDNTHWVHVRGYSNRQHQGISLSGIMGEAIFSGSTAELNELLVWGELLRVGKHIVKGAGYYCLGKG